jgi:hypothetical protein
MLLSEEIARSLDETLSIQQCGPCGGEPAKVHFAQLVKRWRPSEAGPQQPGWG